MAEDKDIFRLPKIPPVGSEQKTSKEQFPLDPIFRFPDSRPGIGVFALAKDLDDVVSSEDACAISPDGTKLAICDGVGGSVIPKPWASLIAQKWINNPLTSLDNAQWNDWLKDSRSLWSDWVQNKWLDHVNRYNFLAGRPFIDNDSKHQGRVEYILRKGASTTFLGVQIDRDRQEIQAIAIGDSCMILIQPETGVYRSFPLQDPSEFGSIPHQIGSLDVPNSQVRGIEIAVKKYYRDEILILATDEFSKWFIKNLKLDPKRTMDIIRGLDLDRFRELVAQERELGSKYSANDDLTVMMVDLNNYLSPGSSTQSSVRYPSKTR